MMRSSISYSEKVSSIHFFFFTSYFPISGVYPYELIQTHSDLARTSLPKKEDFYSSLGVGSNISEEDYNHAREVWEKFGCQTMLDYSHIYVRLDSVGSLY